MPFAVDRLEAFAAAVIEAAGASAEEARIVAHHVVDANLAGHDSHGLAQLPDYVGRIRKGHIVPGAPIVTVRETSTTTVIDGNWGFGFVVSELAMRTTIDKARRHGVAATTVFRQGHVGRVAYYPLMAAEADLIGMMTADSGRSPKAVAPFGGREPRLGTNPICMAVPSDLDGPFFIDMATSACAVGKLKLAMDKGQPIPEGWLIDAQGRPTTDPHDYDRGGVVLALGGPEGHKGYGLSAMVEVLSGVLTGLGFGVEPTGRHNDGCFMAAFDVGAFRDLAEFKREVRDFAEYLRSTPPAEGFDRVYYPGEIEHDNATRRRREGVELAAGTVDRLGKLAAELSVDPL
ncbi:MAG: Ldh family oxidoreductase [Ectothiorhodospiraceae bacterium]|nr:Ldh family oxidoreductase [Chromatiales bacterium]MCP5156539.1 Ldh family oxidoreductase [Ectothiorhodospiraceae bacterium]